MARSRVIGAARLQRALLKLPDDARRELRAAIAGGAAQVAAAAAARAPARTGALKGAIETRLAKSGLGATIGVFKRSKKTHVARFLEFGTVKMAARPWFFPAFRALRARLRGQIEAAARRALKRGGH